MELWMKLMLLAGMAVVFTATAIPASATDISGWPDGWAYCRNVTGGTKVGGNIIFPGLLVLNSTTINYTAMQAAGQDLRIYDAGCGMAANLTPYEIELWDSSSNSYVWFQANSSKNYSYYYGNSTVSSSQNSSGLWQNYKVVFHMNDLTTSSINDSTGNNDDGTKNAANAPIENTTANCKIGECQSFDGTDDWIDFSNMGGLGASDITIEAWVRHPTIAAYSNYIASQHDGVDDAWQLTSSWSTAMIGSLQIYHAPTADTVIGNSPTAINQWIHYVGRRNATVLTLYVNGIQNATVTSNSVSVTSEPVRTRIGARGDNGANDYTGSMDEVRITFSALSNAQINASYQAANNNIFTYNSQQTPPSPPVSNITLTVSITPVTLYTNTDANVSIFYNETAGRHANITLNVSVNGINITNSTVNFTDVTPPITLYYIVESGNYSKGDSLNASATATTDVESENATAGSIIQNSIPTTPSITFSLPGVITGDTLNATGSSTDADSDSLTYRFRYSYSNGTNITAWNTTAVFLIASGYENDTLTLFTLADDGEANSTMNSSNMTVTHIVITWPSHNTEYIGKTFWFSFNFTAQSYHPCQEILGAAGNTTTYSLGNITGNQNHSRTVWYGNNSYNVTCQSLQDSSRVYYKTVNFTNIFANWSVSIYTENDWDVPLAIAGANLSIFVNCEGGSQYVYNFTGSTITNVKPLCDVQSVTAKVDYPSDSYARERSVPSCTSCDIRLYMVDALIYTVLQTPIYMSDYNYFDSKVELYKLSGSNHYTIAEGFFDVEHKYVTYLAKDNTYYIRITKGSEVRDIGYLYAATATAQYLSLSSIRLVPSITLISDNLLMSAAFDNISAPLSVLRIQYEDLMNMTQDIRVQVFNDTSNTAWYDNTFTGISNLSIALNGINTSVRYSVHWTVHHAVLGNSPIEFTAGVGAFGRAVDLGLPAELAWIYPVVAFVLMLFTMFIIVPEIRLVGYLMLMMELGIFTYFAWFNFPLATVALFITFLAAGILYEMKYKGTT